MEPTALESTAESCLHMPGRNSKTGEDDEEAKRSCLDEGKLRSQIGEGAVCIANRPCTRPRY